MSEVSKYGFSDEWSLSEEHPGYVVKTFVVGNMTGELYRPILDPEERAKREKQIMHSVAMTLEPYLYGRKGKNAQVSTYQ
jgi:hypothetical protein